VLALYLSSFGFGCLLTWRLMRRIARRDVRLVCPHCARTLAFSYRRVVATRACPRCAREVLFDTYPTDPVPLSRANADALGLSQRRLLREMVLATALMLLGCGGVAALTDDYRFGLPGYAVVSLIGTLWLRGRAWHHRWREAKKPVYCPRCMQPNEPVFVARFGGCGCCGQPLVAEDAAPDGVADRTPSD
jgi:hypothetical protein